MHKKRPALMQRCRKNLCAAKNDVNISMPECNTSRRKRRKKKKNRQNFVKTSPFRDRVAELRGPSEGLGGGCALLGCTAASRASVEQPIGTSRSSRSKGELVQFEMIQSD